MARQRLTKNIKEVLVKKLLQDTFEEEYMQLYADTLKLVEDAYNELYSEEERKLIDGWPQKWKHGEGTWSIKINFQGASIRAAFDGDPWFHIPERYFLSDKSKREVNRGRTRFCPGSAQITVGVRTEFGKKMTAHERREEDLKNRIQEADRAAWAVLNSFTTVEALIEGWPEIAPYAEQYKSPEVARKAGLPAININQLNKQFKLPRKDAA